MSVRELREFYEKETQSALKDHMLLSLHLKATMMKISDPIMFGHAVTVYFKDVFAGYLRQEPGETVTFIYDLSYLESGQQAIAHTFPLQEAPFRSHDGLHPFFDNLVAEGWLEGAQKRLLGKRTL